MRHHAYVIDPQGKKLSITKFVLSQIKMIDGSPVKSPHNKIESEIQFLKFCYAYCVGEGFTYVPRS